MRLSCIKRIRVSVSALELTRTNEKGASSNDALVETADAAQMACLRLESLVAQGNYIQLKALLELKDLFTASEHYMHCLVVCRLIHEHRKAISPEFWPHLGLDHAWIAKLILLNIIGEDGNMKPMTDGTINMTRDGMHHLRTSIDILKKYRLMFGPVIDSLEETLRTMKSFRM